MREKTFIKATICNAWKKTGLIFFIPEIILSKIGEYQNIQNMRSTTPPSIPIPDTILDCTLHSLKKIIDQEMVLQRQILAGKKVNPKYLSWVIKRSMALAHSRQIVEDELKSV